MALVNALLVRFQTGYAWVVDGASIASYGRREGFLTLGAVLSRDEATRVGNAVLAGAADLSMAVTAGIEPAGGDVPYSDFTVGDYITVPDETGTPAALRVKSLTVGEDTEGNPTYTPELGAMRDERERLVARWLKRMSNGSLGGTVESAGPLVPIREVGDLPAPTPIPPFSISGPVTVATSGPYYPPQNTRVLGITAALDPAHPGSTDTVVMLMRNGIDVATITITAGAVVAPSVPISVYYRGPEGDYLQVRTDSAGTGAEGLVVQLRQ